MGKIVSIKEGDGRMDRVAVAVIKSVFREDWLFLGR